MIEYTVKVYSSHREWFLDGELHREDGPAVIYSDGTEHWYLNGDLHREDGPAIKLTTGTEQWFINGTRLTEAEFNARKQSCNDKVVEISGVKYKLQAV